MKLLDLVAFAKKVTSIMLPAADLKHIDLGYEGSNETLHIMADEARLYDLIHNLIDNAIKYTPSGGITLSVTQHEGFARLVLTDTGIGISSEDIPKLFNKFTRAKDANRQNVIGTGLGLYIAKQMVEAQGGKVWLESEGGGEGTTSIMELPLHHNGI